MVYLAWPLGLGVVFVLLGRDVSLRVNNAMSKSVSVRPGVPQGSV